MSNSIESPAPPQCGACHTASKVVADHHEQGWVLLENGVLVFDDGGEILPDRTVVDAHRPEPLHFIAAGAS